MWYFMKNIMTIDLEDWYQDVEFTHWDLYEDRIIKNTNNLLSILDEKNVGKRKGEKFFFKQFNIY